MGLKLQNQWREKTLLFKIFADIDVFDIEIGTKDIENLFKR
jgi:malic enzyme